MASLHPFRCTWRPAQGWEEDGGKEPDTPGEEGLRDLRIMTAIYESANGGRLVRLTS